MELKRHAERHFVKIKFHRKTPKLRGVCNVLYSCQDTCNPCLALPCQTLIKCESPLALHWRRSVVMDNLSLQAVGQPLLIFSFREPLLHLRRTPRFCYSRNFVQFSKASQFLQVPQLICACPGKSCVVACYVITWTHIQIDNCRGGLGAL